MALLKPTQKARLRELRQNGGVRGGPKTQQWLESTLGVPFQHEHIRGEGGWVSPLRDGSFSINQKVNALLDEAAPTDKKLEEG